MSEATDRVKREAKAIETKLREEGRHMDADAVQRLRLGYANALGTLLRQFTEIHELRYQLNKLIEEAHGG